MYSFKFNFFALNIFSEFVCIICAIFGNIDATSFLDSFGEIYPLPWCGKIHFFDIPLFVFDV
jgi:hypothetical protein